MDVVICFDCAYRMVKEALWVVSSKTPLRVVYIPIQYPIRSEEELVASFKAELDKYEVGGVKLCIIDHVSSMVGDCRSTSNRCQTARLFD